MAEINTRYKKHPLYQEDLARIAEAADLQMLQGKSFLITGSTGL